MQRIFLILCLFALLLVPVMAQDEEIEFPDIIGKTVPEAEALLNSTIYRLDSIILARDEGTFTGVVNTIDAFEIIGDGTVVQVTILREYNVELIWDNADFFAGQVGLGDFDGDELFTFVNLSDTEIALDNIEIGNFAASAWLPFVPGGQCAQIWTNNQTTPVGLTECSTIQGGNVTSLTISEQQFWRTGDNFDIFQHGIYRGTCQTADGRCQLWLSPLPIAEDIAPYIYLIYDTSELIIMNNSATQWMDLLHLRLNDEASQLSEVQNWDYSRYPDDTGFAERLAPGQCARFTTNSNNDALEDCDALLRQDTPQADVFWRGNFTLIDTLNGNNSLNCPAASDERTICLLGR